MTSDLLAAISLDGQFTLLNPAWEQLLGWTIEELKAHPMQELVHPDDLEQTLALTLAGHHRPAQFVNFTNRYRHRDGSWRWLLWSARCDGEAWYAAAKDVTDRMWLERQALHDPLTKLPNRLLLMDRARQAVARLRRSNGPIALLFIDLDRFKAINDNLGHAVGDHLLISVSERLAEMLRDTDTVARLGGDEFVILAEDLDSDAEALAVAERVLHALEEPFLVGSAEVSMLASRGRLDHARPRGRARGSAARGRRGDVPGEGLGRAQPGAVRRGPAPRGQRAAGARGPPRPRAAPPRAAARVPAAAAARRRPAGRLRGARALAPPRRRADGRRSELPARWPRKAS